MYPLTHGFPEAVDIIRTKPTLDEGIPALLARCAEHFPSPGWDMLTERQIREEATEVAECFVHDVETYPIPADIDVLVIAPWEVPQGFDLLGSSTWSTEASDWEWMGRETWDYSGSDYVSTVVTRALELGEQLGFDDPETHTAESFYDVASYLLAVGLFGIYTIGGLQTAGPDIILGASRKELWLVFGYPDLLHGYILGKYTREGWESTPSALLD